MPRFSLKLEPKVKKLIALVLLASVLPDGSEDGPINSAQLTS